MLSPCRGFESLPLRQPPLSFRSTNSSRRRRLLLSRGVSTGFWLVLLSVACSQRRLETDPELLSAAPPELLAQLRADAYTYFRFVNHEWTARVCEIFAEDIPHLPTVQLHGDAHVEQYALMNDAWGLDDFDDSARGPALVDIVRFLGSIDLAARHHGWTRDRDQLFDQFFAGYRRGLTDPSYKPQKPDIVRRLREQAPELTREAFLARAETMMAPMSETPMRGVIAAMEVFTRVVQQERPNLPDEYFRVSRAGWLHLGVGSASSPKILIRARGPSRDPADDVVLEVKTLRQLTDLGGCLDVAGSQPTVRVIAGSQRLGRLQPSILLPGPEVAIPEMTVQGEHLLDWWIRSWEPSYREIGLADLRSIEDLSEIAVDSGAQLGAGSIHRETASEETALRDESLASVNALEKRLRKAAETLVLELLRGWRELGGRQPSGLTNSASRS